MHSISIGFKKQDGEFQSIGTFNNENNKLSENDFYELVDNVKNLLVRSSIEVHVLETQDTPFCVEILT